MEQRKRDKRADRLSPTASGTETGRAIVIEPWLKREVRGDATRSQAEMRTPEAGVSPGVNSPASLSRMATSSMSETLVAWEMT